MMPRVSDAKEKILGAARELFWLHNYGSVSVDDICKKADVKKGSFYHFYESKADLCVQCLDAHWGDSSARADSAFSPAKDPVQRIKDYAKQVYEMQVELKKNYGTVLGCPVTLTGMELSNEDEAIRNKTKDIMTGYCAYFESALREIDAKNLAKIDNIEIKARQLFSFVLGELFQAKITNSTDNLKDELERGLLDLIGIR